MADQAPGTIRHKGAPPCPYGMRHAESSFRPQLPKGLHDVAGFIDFLAHADSAEHFQQRAFRF
jgi:hypothetical protein